CPSRTNPNEVATSRIRSRRRKLRTVGFEECLVAPPILSSPDTLGSLEDPSCDDGVGNNWRVKLCAFAAGYDGTAGDDPFQRIAILEVYIMEVPCECVEAKRRVAHVKTGLTAVAINYLRPDGCRIGWFFQCSVILRPAHQVVRVRGINR